MAWTACGSEGTWLHLRLLAGEANFVAEVFVRLHCAVAFLESDSRST